MTRYLRLFCTLGTLLNFLTPVYFFRGVCLLLGLPFIFLMVGFLLSACGEIPGLKVFVTTSRTGEQDTCSIIVDCRWKSPDKVRKIYSFFFSTRQGWNIDEAELSSSFEKKNILMSYTKMKDSHCWNALCTPW